MRIAEVSVPSVPTASSQILVHHQSIFPSDSHPFLLEDAQGAALELYTVLYTIVVCGVGLFFRGFRPSTSAIMSLTAFAVKSLSLKSDIRFRASCTETDDGVDTDVIRAV